MSRQVLVAVRYGSMPLLGLGLVQLKAETGPEAEEKTAHLVKPRDLPIYSEPKQSQYQLVPEGSSTLRDTVSTVRQQVWKFSDTFQGAVSFTKRTYHSTEETAQSVIKFIKTEEGFYPRAGAISIAGLAGLVLARKGGIIRKVLYSGGLMTATASLCYPYRAVRVAQAEFEWVKAKAADLYKADSTTPAVEKVALVTATDEKALEEGKTKAETSRDAESGQTEGDHGQSKPEDKDMYTTRS